MSIFINDVPNILNSTVNKRITFLFINKYVGFFTFLSILTILQLYQFEQTLGKIMKILTLWRLNLQSLFFKH